MADKYLKKFYDLKESSEISSKQSTATEKDYKEKQESKQRYEEFKKGYDIESLKQGPTIHERDIKKKGKKILIAKERKYANVDSKEDVWEEITPQEKGKALKQASFYMSQAAKPRNIDPLSYVLAGAKLYEALGVGNRASVKRRLLKSYEKNPEPEYAKEVESFLKRNPARKEGKGLEKKFIPVIAGISIVASLFFLSPNITGNVIGNLTKNDSSVVGVTLFVLGIIGFFAYFRKK